MSYNLGDTQGRDENLIVGVVAPVAKKPLKPTKPQALAGKKPTKLVLEGNKWLIVCSFYITAYNPLKARAGTFRK